MTIAKQLKITKFPFIIKDENGNEIYYEDSNGFWSKQEYDINNNEIYYENSTSDIIDNRIKVIPEYTMKELVEKLGENFNFKK